MPEATTITDAGETDTSAGGENNNDTDPDSGLDEHASQVIGAVRKDFKRERAQRQAAERKVAEFERQAQEAADAKKTAEERAQEAATHSEARAQAFRDRAVKAEVKALAASDFADPEDASAFLDLGGYVNDDGDVDMDAIKSDLADLLDRKPHLAKSDRPGPKPDLSQGSGGNNRHDASPSDTFASWWKATSPR